MGLFDKKKKEKSTAEAAENIKLEDADVTASVDTSRRFSVIVDGVTTMLDGNGSIVSGTLFGKVLKGDKVYVYMAGVPAVECEVQAVEAKLEDRTSIVDEAEDTNVSLQLTLPDEVQLKKYSVITNVPPQDKVNPKVSVENPALAGIINGMTTYGKDNGFHATAAYHVSHGHFLTPIKMDAEPEVNENGVAVIKKDTRIGFYMLKSQIKLAGTPEDKDSMVLPLFTDWTSLRRWEGLDALLKRGDAYAGIAINPFNPVPCTLPIPYLDTITGTPGYQAEFAPKSEGGHVKEEKVPAGKRILLGVPKDGEETNSIRAKLLEYGKAHDDIYSISFLTKVEEDTKVVRHLVVLEFPEEYTPENMKPHMEAIYQELAPIAKEINQIEYAIKGKIPAIDNVVAEHALQMVVYTK